MSSPIRSVQTPHSPEPKPGAAPVRVPARRCTRHCDRIAPRAARPVPITAPPRHLVNGTPEVVAAGLALGGAALGAEAIALGAGTAARSTTSYASRLVAGVVRCISDPMKTGEHIAEGVVGGAAWAAAAAGVTALADAARSHYTSATVPAR